ncbi:MAG: fumarylacetoacetate hydrolase family protein [Alphaproteobacteria bacterium]|nr:fumarylacetoacetate hydrolase family protein [Alphaproteobacteria bacterium]MCB9696215.1 fumarylacetoacetate hydrolase family protein [Alphaproteobacteria bacterium]
MRATRHDGSAVEVGTVYGIGRNYALHVAELGNAIPEEPLVFLKARTSVRGLAPSPMAFADEAFHHELEVVLLIGRPVQLGEDPGWEAVEGVTLGLDLTRRTVQSRCKEKGLPWTTAKSFAGSAVLAPFLPRSAVSTEASLGLTLEVNGELRQRGRTELMLFPVPVLLRHLASLAPLEPGDLVFTGTPEGVGPIRVGDGFRMRLESVGTSWTWDGVL